MGENKKSKSKTTPPPECLATGEMPTQPEKEVRVRYQPVPSRPPADQKIHPRQRIPAVPQGEEVPDATPSPPVKLD